MISVRILSCVLLAGAAVWAEVSPRGHWTGAVEIPEHALAMEVDMDSTEKGWIGSVSIPAQNASGIPLSGITFAEGKLVFHIQGAPGDPTFTGTVSADGQKLSGQFSQGPSTFPFHFSRAGDPKVTVPKSSPAVAKEFVGTWEGTLEAGQSLRLVLKLSNDENGAKAVLVSLDQGGGEIPVSSIEQKDASLALQVSAVGGQYSGEINKAGTELTGTWTQSGNELPLKFKKAAPDAPKP